MPTNYLNSPLAGGNAMAGYGYGLPSTARIGQSSAYNQPQGPGAGNTDPTGINAPNYGVGTIAGPSTQTQGYNGNVNPVVQVGTQPSSLSVVQNPNGPNGTPGSPAVTNNPANPLANGMASAPTPYSYNGGGSTDPNTFTTQAYIKNLNSNVGMFDVNQANQYAYSNYQTAYNNWVSNGSVGPPPTPPTAQKWDPNQFNTAWDANMQPGGNFSPDAFNAAMGNVQQTGNTTTNGQAQAVMAAQKQMFPQLFQQAGQAGQANPATTVTTPPAGTGAGAGTTPATWTAASGLPNPNIVNNNIGTNSDAFSNLFNGSAGSMYNSAGMPSQEGFNNPFAFMTGQQSNQFGSLLQQLLGNQTGNLSGPQLGQLLNTINNPLLTGSSSGGTNPGGLSQIGQILNALQGMQMQSGLRNPMASNMITSNGISTQYPGLA